MRLRPYVVNIRLDAGEIAQVRRLADCQDVSVSHLMREALKTFVEKEERGSGGEGKSG